MSYPSRGRKVRRRRKNLNIRNLIILITGLAVTILLFILLVHGAVRLISNGIDAITGLGEGPSNVSSSVTGESGSSSETSEPPVSWTTVELTEADEREGSLILVNAAHEYTSEPEGMTVLYGNKSNSYVLSFAEMYLKDEALGALNSMMNDFQSYSSIGNTLVTSTYRTVEEQETLYNNDVAATGGSTSDSVAQPGHSEHHTGYAADLMYSSAGGGWTYLDGAGQYAWFNENCYKYGYIVRYTADKQAITGIISEPWHLRYVGPVHAEAITKGSYCLEEYIDMVKLHDFENPYSFASEDGDTYLIYYVEGQGATTEVPVQVGRSYLISGTNEGGFIVTIPVSSAGGSTAASPSAGVSDGSESSAEGADPSSVSASN